MSLHTRVSALEASMASVGRCPQCPPVEIIAFDDADPPELVCQACGRPSDAIVVREVLIESREQWEAMKAATED